MHVIIAAEVSYLWGSSCLSLLEVDDLGDLISLVDSSSVGSELGLGRLEGLLIFGDIHLHPLEHLLLKRREAGNFSDDLSDSLRSLGKSASSGDGSGLPGLVGHVDDVAVVKSDEDAASVVGFSHVFY